jgi:hypothetical protein
MKFACLGYIDEKRWNAMSQRERDAMIEECLAYDDELVKSGRWSTAGNRCKASERPRPCGGRAASWS